MKTRTLVFTPIFIFVVVAIFIFTACTNNDDGALTPGWPFTPGGSFFTYDGTIYPLASAIIEEYGANTLPGESGYDLDFVAFSPGLDPTTFTGIGDVVYLDLNSPNPTLASGTYTWSSTRTDYTLVDAGVILNLDLATGGGTSVMAIGGTVTISVNGNIYTVEFTLAMEDGKTVTGSYSGPATVL